MDLFKWLTNINASVNGIVWGIPAIALILGVGVWVTIGTKAVQFRHFGWAMKNTVGKIFKKQSTADKGAMTPFQAVSTALASTVGTGNIAGVAGAIALGGPGAVFWMWVAALLGMCTKYCEVVLAIRYRERNARGEWAGGPMYYITNGLGKNWKWLAVAFAAFGSLAAFGIGNMTQCNSISGVIGNAVQTFSPNPDAIDTGMVHLITGIAIAILIGLILFGGLKRIGAVAEKIIPLMAVFYIIGGLAIILVNIDMIGPCLAQIFSCAFGGKAILGGTAGFTIGQALRRGCARGIFSNEAGLGSAPIAHASADTPGPVEQGFYGIFEVFLDTIVICTITALVILMSGVSIGYGQSAGAALSTASFASVFGTRISALFMAVALGLFAFTTILGWSLYGTRCAEYLFGHKVVLPYQIVYVLMVIVGSTMELSLAWDIADTLNGLMAIPNLIAVALLSPVVFRLTREYFAKAKGKTGNTTRTETAKAEEPVPEEALAGK
jgi:AGCS family alanine or glycine:cation symporter